MKTKMGVKLEGLNIKMRPVLMAADKIYKQFGQELVITCTTGFIHSAGSLHYYGYAIDLRSRYFDDFTLKQVVANLQNQLGQSYNVIAESDHIHVEYDKAKKL